MRKIQIHQIDSFTTKLFGGNPAGVVTNAQELNEVEMRKIAREMNLSETAFVLPAEAADLRLRFFTPSEAEIRFCGHATIGAMRAIAKEGIFGLKAGVKKTITVETQAGTFSVEVNLPSDGKEPTFRMEVPSVDFAKAPVSLEEVTQALGINKEYVDFNRPLLWERNLGLLYFSSPSLEALGRISIDLQRATEYCKRSGTVVVAVLTPRAFSAENQVHSRGFAPGVGIPEDPFTGATQGGVAAYLMKEGLLPQTTRWIGAEQGHFMGRPGEVKIEVQNEPSFKAFLHAQAVHVFSGTIELP
jgi:PhzF family phenazine biosynthesis protein